MPRMSLTFQFFWSPCFVQTPDGQSSPPAVPKIDWPVNLTLSSAISLRSNKNTFLWDIGKEKIIQKLKSIISEAIKQRTVTVCMFYLSHSSQAHVLFVFRFDIFPKMVTCVLFFYCIFERIRQLVLFAFFNWSTRRPFVIHRQYISIWGLCEWDNTGGYFILSRFSLPCETYTYTALWHL